jgi:hypothetical protein
LSSPFFINYALISHQFGEIIINIRRRRRRRIRRKRKKRRKRRRRKRRRKQTNKKNVTIRKEQANLVNKQTLAPVVDHIIDEISKEQHTRERHSSVPVWNHSKDMLGVAHCTDCISPSQ